MNPENLKRLDVIVTTGSDRPLIIKLNDTENKVLYYTKTNWLKAEWRSYRYEDLGVWSYLKRLSELQWLLRP